METKPLFTHIEPLLSPLADRLETPTDTRLDVYLPVEKLLEVVQTLLENGWAYLSAITGLDVPPTDSSEGQIEILYHFCYKAAILTLRVRVPYSRPNAPSVCGLLPYATLYERELMEMFGVLLEGTPSTDRLLLPDDWPDDVYPLRKSFKGL